MEGAGRKIRRLETTASATSQKTLDRTRREIDRAQARKPGREEFTAELRENGIDAVFRENDAGRIYGVTFIDRTTHQVFNGSRLGKEYAANAFEAWFNGREQESSHPCRKSYGRCRPSNRPAGISSVKEGSSST